MREPPIEWYVVTPLMAQQIAEVERILEMSEHIEQTPAGGWGFWDETQSTFYCGYGSRADAALAMSGYADLELEGKPDTEAAIFYRTTPCFVADDLGRPIEDWHEGDECTCNGEGDEVFVVTDLDQRTAMLVNGDGEIAGRKAYHQLHRVTKVEDTSSNAPIVWIVVVFALLVALVIGANIT